VSSGGSAQPPSRIDLPASQIDAPWTVRGLVASHKPAAVLAGAAFALTVVLIVVAMLAASGGSVSDATSCTQWGSANVNQQHAYAKLYVREHGSIPRWGSSPTMVINAINAGCFQAYGDDVSDNTTIVQAISGNF
jgi:hypothetical protein